MTAHALQGDRECCMAAEMNGDVTKPISGASFAQTTADALGRPPALPSAEDNTPLPGPVATADGAEVKRGKHPDKVTR
jgi:hypothetical protein